VSTSASKDFILLCSTILLFDFSLFLIGTSLIGGGNDSGSSNEENRFLGVPGNKNSDFVGLAFEGV